jgi:hypothetical protein
MRGNDQHLFLNLLFAFFATGLWGCGSGNPLANGGDPNSPGNPDSFLPQSYPSNTAFKIAMTSKRFSATLQTVLWHSNTQAWEVVPGTTGSLLPFLSESGKYLTFSSFNGPGVVKLDGSMPTFPITATPSHAVTPFLSPNGDTLYFVSDERTGVRGTIRGYGIWSLSPSGVLDELMERDSKFSLLTSDYLVPTISHDGTKLAYYRRALFTGDITIEQSNADGTNPILITRPRNGYKLMQFNYSHDGKYLLMLECLASDPVPTHCDIVRWDFATSSATWLTQSASAISSPIFSLDDKRIFYLSGINITDQQIFSMSIDGTGQSIFLDKIHGTEVLGTAGGNTISISLD